MNATQAKIDRLVEKRDYAANVLKKDMLAWSYQVEIDKLCAASTAASIGKRLGELIAKDEK